MSLVLAVPPGPASPDAPDTLWDGSRRREGQSRVTMSLHARLCPGWFLAVVSRRLWPVLPSIIPKHIAPLMTLPSKVGGKTSCPAMNTSQSSEPSSPGGRGQRCHSVLPVGPPRSSSYSSGPEPWASVVGAPPAGQGPPRAATLAFAHPTSLLRVWQLLLHTVVPPVQALFKGPVLVSRRGDELLRVHLGF